MTFSPARTPLSRPSSSAWGQVFGGDLGGALLQFFCEGLSTPVPGTPAGL